MTKGLIFLCSFLVNMHFLEKNHIYYEDASGAQLSSGQGNDWTFITIYWAVNLILMISNYNIALNYLLL